jgi:hypothetical protein
LGIARTNDIAVNAILPWLFARAVAGKNNFSRRKASKIWFECPKLEDNTILRQARARLLGNAPTGILKSAAHQQGLLQIVGDYCNCSDAICRNCKFPDLVEKWRQSSLEVQ